MLRRLRMKSTRVQPLSLSNRPSTQSTITTTEAASQGSRGLIIVALHLVFVFIRGGFTVT